MTMLPRALAFLAGLCVGAVYLAILWASVRRVVGGASAWTFAVSAILRMALVAGATAGVLALGLPAAQLALAGLGFLAARMVATRLARPERKET